MTRKEALQELAKEVSIGPSALFSAFSNEFVSLFSQQEISLMEASYNGSMDSALSLFESVLPGWGVCVWTGGAGDWAATVSIAPLKKPRSQHGGKSTTPSRALLIAILEALVGMEP